MKVEKKMNVLLIVGICVILGVFGQILMKRGMTTIGVVGIRDLFSLKLFSIITNPHVFVGIVLYGIASVLWLAALSMEEVSYIYPLIGTGYILTAILAWVFFGENLTAMKVIGIILISIGAYLVVVRW
jgi:drug/metabolite transporter (DMT)-like permease